MLQGPADFELTQIWNWSQERAPTKITFTRLDLKQLGALCIYKCHASAPVKLRIGSEIIEFEPKPQTQQEGIDPFGDVEFGLDLPYQAPTFKLYFEDILIVTSRDMLAYTEVELIAEQECQLTYTPRFATGDDRVKSWLMFYPFKLDLGWRKYRINKGSLTFIN